MPARDDGPSVVRFADFQLDVRAGELRSGDRCILLHPQPLHILMRLLERPGELVTRDDLRREIWGDDTFVDFEHGLNAAIKRLREALGDSAQSPRFIETLPRRGYRLLVQRDGEPNGAPAMQAGAAPREARSRRTVAVATLVAIAAVLGGFLALNLAGTRDWLIGGPPHIRSVAVLPFTNQTNDAAQDYLADGIHEAVLTDLARMGGVKVVSRTSVMRYRNTRQSAADIGRELDVDALVEGSYARVGEHVRVTVRLAGSGHEALVWAGRYERPAGDLMPLSAEIARDIAGRIGVTVTAVPAASRTGDPAARPAAVDAYWKGRYLVNRFPTGRRAETLTAFDEAIRLDPSFAPALAARALMYGYQGRAGMMSPPLAFANARADAERALTLDGSLEEARAALGLSRLYRDWDWDGSGQELRRALASNPNNSWLYVFYADYLLVMNRPGEALEYARRGRDLDPFSAVARAAVGEALSAAGRFDDAIDECRKALDMEPRAMPAISCLEDALWWKGEREQTIRSVMRRFSGTPLTRDMEAALAAGGPAAALRVMVDRFTAAGASGLEVEPFNVARFYAALNEPDRAFTWLDRAFNERAPLLLQLRCNADFAPLRGDPRYADLVRRIGFPD